jgi:hypothetical protein
MITAAIVWDEFVGYWITMLVAFSGWKWAVAGFLLFRFFVFDIVKPWPIGWVDCQVGGGLGIAGRFVGWTDGFNLLVTVGLVDSVKMWRQGNWIRSASIWVG